ncbi:E3 ubiquitin-protein ligase SGR9, amyloplastic [Ricinus communis]|uniref:RING-type E3 ubiquitin transferase n=1 Tax=Ricinus communis TaxID=3988 RepID=B9SGU1_RICCO|nr:E3 ubiquitin-protein ligase SGR9, amyloplastic [Ricinus communis]EEF37176.1 zinc finger protein, putative [Ricinus communis]|eukprot:XP_002525210.1 E3 ubiquitin-protein ligase SGR9, amyloplastic [Ricinus communis]
MEDETMIMAALSTLTPPQLSHLTHSILSQTLHHHHSLSSLLSSPSSFSLTLHHLHSLSLPHKTLLIAKHLLSSLHQLTRFFPSPSHPSATIKHRDLDAVLLLLLLCDVHQHNPDLLRTPRDEWRGILTKRCSDTILTHSGIGVHYGGVLLPYVEMITRCWKFVAAMGGCGEKEGREVAAAPSAVVALPTVEVTGDVTGECAICREEMREGRDVCELPCQHLFHWMCILPWLKKRNTCPCCRFQLPTEDVLGEIKRLWSVLMKAGGGSGTLTLAES